MERQASLITCERVDFASAWDLQHRLLRERTVGRRLDTLILLEHNPVFTIGRSGRAAHCGGDENSLRARGFPVYRVERGGSVTFHGPGQIVGYPILHLRSFCSGPKAYMRLLEDVLIRVLAAWGLRGRRFEKLTGVWVGEDRIEKVAAMGVRIIEGVTMHGFALNVTVDLDPFRDIVPCGIPDCRVTSMASLLGHSPDVSAVRDKVAEAFAEVFGLRWVERLNNDQILTGPATEYSQGPDVLGVTSLPGHPRGVLAWDYVRGLGTGEKEAACDGVG